MEPRLVVFQDESRQEHRSVEGEYLPRAQSPGSFQSDVVRALGSRQPHLRALS